MDLLTIASILIFLTVLYKYFSRNLDFWAIMGVKGPKPVPVFGNLLENIKKPINYVELERIQKYGKVYGTLELSQPVLTVADNELIKLIAIKDFNCFTNHSSLAPGDPFLSQMVAMLEDDDWKRVRNIVSSAFSPSKVKQMFDLVDQCADNIVSFFDESAVQKKPIETKKSAVSFSIDTIAAVALGTRIKSNEDKYSEFLKHALNVLDFKNIRLIVALLLPSKLRILSGFQVFAPNSIAYFKQYLEIVIEERRNKNSEMKDLVKALLDAELSGADEMACLYSEDRVNNVSVRHVNVSKRQQKLTEDEIIAQCILFLMAAFETTSTALSYFLYTMATKPEIQKRLYEEVKVLFDSEKELYDYDSLMSLTYLDAVIHETLRMYTPVVHFDRVAKVDYELGDTGITIPKGTVINIPFHAVCHDPDYWPEPNEFIPERFFPENKVNIKPCTFIPFGVGPRMCLGWKVAMLELKVVAARIIQRFEILRKKKTPEIPKYCSKKILLLCEEMIVDLKLRIH